MSYAQYAEEQKHTFLAEINEGFVTAGQIEHLQYLVSVNPGVKRILEIGFNGGNSAAAMLSARPDVELVSFDIGSHNYVAKAKRLVDTMFPGRHKLVMGDSTQTLPRFNCPETDMFDIAFIDGGHWGEVPYLDIRNCCKMVRVGGMIVVDDMSYPDVRAGFVRSVDEGLIELVGTEHDADRDWVYCVRIKQKH